MIVTSIDILQCRLPMSPALWLGPIQITHRDHVAIRFTLEDGTHGYANGYDRRLPLFDIVAQAASDYVGRSLDLRAQSYARALGPTPAPRATMIRGASLCDCAAWDAYATALAKPLWAVLGGQREDVPVMPIVGYGMGPEVIAEKAAALCRSGYGIIKLMLDGTDTVKDIDCMEALAAALPPGRRFGIDAHWSFRSPAEAIAICRVAERLGAAFIEDPFAPTQWRAAERLQSMTTVPIAMGEDAIDLAAFADIASASSILRVDATVSGGVTGAMAAIALAKAQGLSVIPHVAIGLHAQLAFTSETVMCVEAIFSNIGGDPIEDFLTDPLNIVDGKLRAPTTPGAGTTLDWDGLSRLASRAETYTASGGMLVR